MFKNIKDKFDKKNTSVETHPDVKNINEEICRVKNINDEMGRVYKNLDDDVKSIKTELIEVNTTLKNTQEIIVENVRKLIKGDIEMKQKMEQMMMDSLTVDERNINMVKNTQELIIKETDMKEIKEILIEKDIKLRNDLSNILTGLKNDLNKSIQTPIELIKILKKSIEKIHNSNETILYEISLEEKIQKQCIKIDILDNVINQKIQEIDNYLNRI